MTLAVFLGAAPYWRSSDGSAGDGLAIAEAHRAGPVIAVLPGEAVAVHFVTLPELAPAQALAAARLLAADVAGGGIAGTHVAIGARLADGTRPLALVDAALLRGWLGELAAAGIDPDAVVPEALLLPLPDGDAIAVHRAPGRWVLHGAGIATAAEPVLAAMLAGGRVQIEVTAPLPWDAAGAPRLPIDLRQGDFARVQRWRPSPARLRRLGWLAVASLACTVAAEAAATWRATVAADRAALQRADAARTVLPRGSDVSDPPAAVAARLAAIGGGGGFVAAATALSAAVERDPGASVTALGYTQGGGLVATIALPAGSGAATATALAAAAMRPGLLARAGVLRDDAGAAVFDLRLAPRPLQ